MADVLNGTPSIVVGVFAWAWIVATQKHFSALAGSAALAMLMIPMVLRTTEEMIKLVPNSLREAALALGYPRWRTSLSIVVRTTLPGIVTGSLLAVARIAGETAPLLFTALGSQYLSFNLNQPMAALPLTVFTYATGPYEEWHQYAWAAALVLILVVFVLSLGARLATAEVRAQWLSRAGERRRPLAVRRPSPPAGRGSSWRPTSSPPCTASSPR